jgi:hypothetical protein
MKQPDRNPALERLDALVGEWSMEARPPGGPPWPGEGRVTFEWLEGRRFLIERWRVDLPEAPDGIAIIGAGDQPETFRQYYFDSRGVHRIYENHARRRRDRPRPRRRRVDYLVDGHLHHPHQEHCDDHGELQVA